MTLESIEVNTKYSRKGNTYIHSTNFIYLLKYIPPQKKPTPFRTLNGLGVACRALSTYAGQTTALYESVFLVIIQVEWMREWDEGMG